MPEPSRSVIWNIQALRFIAAFMVLLSHLYHEVPSVRGLAVLDYEPWLPVFWAGGVDIFFVISGFIMFSVGANKFGRPGCAKEFMMRRLIRVAPPYWLFTTSMILAIALFKDQIVHNDLAWPHVLASYMFLPWQNAEGRYYPILILGWTLNFEMAFYLIFAVALTQKRRLGLAALTAALSLAALVGMVTPPQGSPLAFWCNPIVIEFLLGIGLGLLRSARWRVNTVFALPLFAAGLLVMVLTQAYGIAGSYWVWRWAWMGLPATLLVYSAILLHDESPPSYWQRVLGFLGDTSFALYLSHPFSLGLVKLIWWQIGPADPNVFLVAAGAISILSAVLVYIWVERPLTVWLTRRYVEQNSSIH